MNSLTHRLVSCVSIGAIFTLLALAFKANHWLVALAFISATACAWISADINGFVPAVKDRIRTMKVERQKLRTSRERRLGRITRAYRISGIVFAIVWISTAIVWTVPTCFVFSDMAVSSIKEVEGVLLSYLIVFTVYVALIGIYFTAHGTYKRGRLYGYREEIRDIRAFREALELMMSHRWVASGVLGFIRCVASILEYIPGFVVWLWKHFVLLVKSVHTNERLVYSVSVALGMLAGFYTGHKTESLALGTCVGGAGGALFAWLDWKVFSVWLCLRENPPIPPTSD